MAKRKKETEDVVARAARRLLQSLEEPGARCAPSDVKDKMFVVVAPRNGVTVVRASVPSSAVDYSLAHGFLKWSEGPQAKGLRPTQEGRAFLRRSICPENAHPFRAQHSPIATRALEKGAAPVLFNEGESPLAWLARRKDRRGASFLTAAMVQAGERFRRDVTQAQLLQRVTVNWEATTMAPRHGGDAGAHISEIAVDARRRLSRACDAVGPDLAGLLTDVCGYLKGLEAVETERGWPRRSGKVVLKIALDRLSRHYGMANEAHGPRSGALRQWGAEDYRPSLDAAGPDPLS